MSSFTPAGSGGQTQSVSIVNATTPILTLVPVTLATTEYSFSIPTNTRQFLVKLKDLAPLQLSYQAGQSGTAFLSIPQGCFYSEGDLNLTAAVTIYFQSPSAGQTLEILVWL